MINFAVKSSAIQQNLNTSWLKGTWAIDRIAYEKEECVVWSCQNVLNIRLRPKKSLTDIQW